MVPNSVTTETSSMAVARHEPLLHPTPAYGTAAEAGGGGGFSWLTAPGFAFLTFNSGMAMYRSGGDAAAVAFVAFSYVDLVLLFCCLRWFGRAPLGSPTREHLKVAIWLLSTLLTVASTYKVAAAMPAPVQVLLWVMAGATVLGGFYAFFLHKEGKDIDEDVDATSPNERVKKILGVVLASLRWRWPEAGGGILAQDPRDVAWSGARMIVDSGATRHAVGNIFLLEGFEPYMPPLVATLADGSNLHILGVGHIQRGHFSIPNVTLVEGVQDCLISTQQLDSDHGLISCFGSGVCRIMQADGTVVGGAMLEQAVGYVLRFLDVPGPPQAQTHQE